jgi:hypothetical protein
VREFLHRAMLTLMLGLGLAFVGSAQPSAETRCLGYEPAVVKLTGTLTRETFPGPPNYESVRDGDKPETYLILNLAHPVCVDADKTDTGLNPAQKDIRRVQLVFTGTTGDAKYKDFVSKEVVATGTLFAAQTGHHHTPVLLTVKNLARIK